MKSVILIACFLPLAIIYIVMKLALWLSATSVESKYVKPVGTAVTTVADMTTTMQIKIARAISLIPLTFCPKR